MVVKVHRALPKRDRTVKIVQDTTPHRQVQETITHLSNGWLPADPIQLSLVKKKIQTGAYSLDRIALLDDVRKDPGLYIYCLRKLNELKSSDRIYSHDPLEALLSIEEEKITSLLNVPESQVSLHRFKDMNRNQALRMQHTLLSSITATEAASQVSLSTDHAYAGTVLRQIGLNLISWNYPHLYSRALKKEKETPGSMDVALEKFLKISPGKLGLVFARKWHLPLPVRDIFSSWQATNEIKGKNNENFINLQSICEMSELYAQVKDPEHYPHAKNQWEQVQEHISPIIPEQVFNTAVQKAQKILLDHDSINNLETLPIIEETIIETKGHTHRSEELFEANRYIQKLSNEDQNRFHSVYNNIQTATISVSAIKQLVDEVVPVFGILRGCLFLYNHDASLRPALRIGDLPLEHYEKLLQQSWEGISMEEDYLFPVKYTAPGLSDETVCQICCSLDNHLHPGLLYMELPPEGELHAEESVLHVFNAIRFTLNDCINTEEE